MIDAIKQFLYLYVIEPITRPMNLRRFWRSVAHECEQLRQADGPINDEYCWMHKPGGWTCQECREAE